MSYLELAKASLEALRNHPEQAGSLEEKLEAASSTSEVDRVAAMKLNDFARAGLIVQVRSEVLDALTCAVCLRQRPGVEARRPSRGRLQSSRAEEARPDAARSLRTCATFIWSKRSSAARSKTSRIGRKRITRKRSVMPPKAKEEKLELRYVPLNKAARWDDNPKKPRYRRPDPIYRDCMALAIHRSTTPNSKALSTATAGPKRLSECSRTVRSHREASPSSKMTIGPFR